MTTLDNYLAPKVKNDIRALPFQEVTASLHLDLGMGLRNSWGLWVKSRMAQYFAHYGVHNPDNMSAVILECYWYHLHGRPLHFREVCRKYRDQPLEEQNWE